MLINFSGGHRRHGRGAYFIFLLDMTFLPGDVKGKSAIMGGDKTTIYKLTSDTDDL